MIIAALLTFRRIEESWQVNSERYLVSGGLYIRGLHHNFTINSCHVYGKTDAERLPLYDWNQRVCAQCYDRTFNCHLVCCFK